MMIKRSAVRSTLFVLLVVSVAGPAGRDARPAPTSPPVCAGPVRESEQNALAQAGPVRESEQVS